MKEYYFKNTDDKLPSNKGFGITFSIIFLIIFLFKTYISKSFNESFVLLIISIILFVLSYIKPNSFYLLNRAWNKVGFILSKIFNVIFSFLCFCIVILPTSFFMKLITKYDPMNLNKKKTLWIKRDEKHPTSDLKDQF